MNDLNQQKKNEKLIDLLYQFAQHIRHAHGLRPAPFGVKSLQLLLELRDLDPQAYREKVFPAVIKKDAPR